MIEEKTHAVWVRVIARVPVRTHTMQCSRPVWDQVHTQILLRTCGRVFEEVHSSCTITSSVVHET